MKWLILIMLLIPLLLQSQELLDLEGAIKIGRSNLPDTAAVGTIRWTGRVFQGWTGSAWENLNNGLVADLDGNVYRTIKLGTQEWMAENVRTTKYQNGDDLLNLVTNTSWMNATAGAWCFYQNNISFQIPFGKLYNWYAVDDNRGLCPTGWHVPSDGEWDILADFLAGSEVAGGKMKIVGVDYWNAPNAEATNESGFTAYPAEFRRFDGSFGDPGNSAIWWTTTPMDMSNAFERDLQIDDGNLTKDFAELTRGHSVRCLRN